jgi:uncharacterized phage infection (PIP) family protein YhgE
MEDALVTFIDKFGIETGMMVFLIVVILKVWQDQFKTFQQTITEYRNELTTVHTDVREHLHSTLQDFHNTLTNLTTVINDNHHAVSLLLAEMETLKKDFTGFANAVRNRGSP